MNLSNLLSLNYWFSLQNPGMKPTAFLVTAVLFFAALVAAIALKVVSKRFNKNPPLARFLRRLGNPFLCLGLVGYIFFFFRYEIILFLGARFWLLLLGLGFLFWVAMLVIKFLKTYKNELSLIARDKEFRKYLPK